MIEVDCRYSDTCKHEYPDDWIFGGADELHPGADPRYVPTIYTYFDSEFRPIWSTTEYLCDEQAIEKFTWVRDIGPSFHPKYVQANLPGEKPRPLPWVYDEVKDEVTFTPPS